jgi:hypothetical protein
MNGDEDPLQKLWKLTLDLSNQLAANRDLAAGLKTQVTDVKTRAEAKILPGFQIENFDIDSPITSSPLDPTDLSVPQGGQVNGNYDLGTTAQRHYELQRQHKAVIAHNQYLEQECLQLQHLVRDLEQGLELVMGRVRVHAHNTTTTTLSLTRHYQLLMAQEQQKTNALLSQNLTLQGQLSHLGSKMRDAYEGELEPDSSIEIERLRVENACLREMLNIAEWNDVPGAGLKRDMTMLMSEGGEVPPR